MPKKGRAKFGGKSRLTKDKIRKEKSREKASMLEVTLSRLGTVELVEVELPGIQFAFKNLEEVNESAEGTLVGIIYAAEDLVSGVNANGRAWAFRKVLITDQTKAEFGLKLWGKLAQEFKLCKPTVAVLRRVKLDKYENIKALATTFQTTLWLNPLIPEAEPLEDLIQQATGNGD